MKTTNATNLRKYLKSKLDLVSEDKEVVIVHRSGQEDVVMIPLSEYNSWKETQYLFSTKANREHLKRSITQAKKKETITTAIDDLWK